MVLIGCEILKIVLQHHSKEPKRKKYSTYTSVRSVDLPSTEELIRSYGEYWDYEECD